MRNILFLSHPYHRGGVTQWMADAFNEWNDNFGNAYFVTVQPKQIFISAPDRPEVRTMLSCSYQQHLFFASVGRLFELGTLEYKASTYRKIIKKVIYQGTPVIPSDDEACWMAAAACADRNPMVAILHADEELYFQLVEKYKAFVCVFICVSSRILIKLLKRYPQFSNRAIALPCGILVDQFTLAPDKAEIIAWVGRLSRYQKRAQDIIPLFEIVREKWPACRLQVLGHGDYSETIITEAEQLELRDSVEITGWVDSAEIRRRLSKTKVFLQTSDFEGTSVAMMEALASGCTVVSTRVSGAEDLESLPEAGDVIYLYSIGNIEEGARLMINAIRDHNLTSSEKARSLASKYFDCKVNIKILFNFTDEVMRQEVKFRSWTISVVKIYISPLIALVRWSKRLLNNFLIKG